MPSPKRRAFYLNPVKYQTPNASGNASKRPRRENPEVYRMAVGSERKRSPEIIELLDTKDHESDDYKIEDIRNSFLPGECLRSESLTYII